MTEYDPLVQPYPSNRFCITARHGMVSSSSALASSAGLEVMRRGGNAIDAAVAAAAALTVTEPTSNGLGSDSFALIWYRDRLYGLNASGYSPKHISLKEVLNRCPDGRMPKHGWLPVMVPGAVSSWAALTERFGKLPLKETLAPAIAYAEQGYPVSPLLGHLWENCFRDYSRCFGSDPVFAEWFRVFTKDGKPYRFGDMVRLPDHARTLKLIAETDGRAFYQGEIAEQFIRQSQRDGGCFCLEDLAEYQPEWVEPISVNYRGYDVWEIPPNGQGITALMALNILKEFSFEERNAETFHRQIEAMKLAFADAKHYISDPSCMTIDYRGLIAASYGAQRAGEITEHAAIPACGIPPKGGTVYLAAADGDGNMVSYIQSNYDGFGSGIVLEGYGTALSNRGSDFSLKETDINVLRPHKKSYHTIIPGFLTKDGKEVGPFGVMGGYMQPQGHVQTVMNLTDFHLNPQMALDAPRWQWVRDKSVLLEPGFDPAAAAELARKGHDICFAKDRTGFGRGQIIQRLANGVLVGACESRTDSNIAVF
ncbi:MAG: gamma-glutamyltransferase family protein [Solobacterium sp.]|nr:gamma-glutamyltransferase family protein [Solobacterium sp.]